MSCSDDDLTTAITHSLSLLLPSILGSDWILKPDPPACLHRPFSFMFRFLVQHSNGGMKSLLVKIPHDSWMKSIHEAVESSHISAVVQGEYAGLQAIAIAIASSSNPALVAIHPLTLISEFNALVFEETPIYMLKTRLVKSAIILGRKKDWQTFENQLRLSAEWLKVIHTHFSQGKKASLQKLGIREQLESELTALESLLHRPLNSLREKIVPFFGQLSSEQVPLSSLHNDFQLGNIFINADGQMGALDPNWLEEGSVYADLATLLIDPLIRKLQVLTQGLAFRSILVKRFERSILEAYFSSPAPPNHSLDLFCALAVLRKWREDEEQLLVFKPRFPGLVLRFTSIYFQRYFSRLILRYLHQGQYSFSIKE